MSNRFNDLIKAAQENFAGRGGLDSGRKQPRMRRQFTRQIVKVGRLDKIEWEGNLNEKNSLFAMTPVVGIRHDPEVNAAIEDLFYGDTKNPDERPAYLNGPELLQDLFMCFLHPNPQLYRKGEVVKDARLNGKFIEQMLALPVYEELHDYTMGDPVTSKDALLALTDVIKEMIKKHREAVEKSNEQRQESSGTDPNGEPGNGSDPNSWDEESQGGGQSGKQSGKSQGGKSGGKNEDSGKSRFEKGDDDGDDEDDPEKQEDWDPRDDEDEDETSGAEGGDDADDGDGDEDGEGQDGLLDEQDRDFNEDADVDDYDKESDWEKMIDGLDIGRYANAALEKAAAEMGELKEARSGIGLTEEEWKMMDPSARLKIAKQLNTPRMKAIADMVGRMKRFALTKQAQKIIDAPHEIYTIKQGNDLTRTVRSEFGLLGMPETKVWFYYKFINGELLQYEKRGNEDVGRGPMIVCIDNSGSMNGAPENWAKGVAEALRRIASDQDRDYHVIYFETNRHRERFDFPGGKGPYDKVMAFLSVSAGGGTEFDGVLTEALAKAQGFYDSKPDAGKSDIVFITDGMANLDQKWIDDFNTKRKEAGVRVFSIHISAYDYDRGACMGLLKKFSDVAVPVKALEVTDTTTEQLFSTI